MSTAPETAATDATPSPGRFVMLPHHILRRTDIGPAAKLVLAAILDRIGKNDAAWPGHEIIAEDVGMSRATVQRSIRELVSAGLLTAASRGPGRSLLYKLPNLSQSESRQSESRQSESRQSDAQGCINPTGGVHQIDARENQTNEPEELNQKKERSIKTKCPKFSKAEIESIRLAYPLKIAKAAVLKAIGKALGVIAKRGTRDPTGWLLDRVVKFAASPLGDLNTKPETPYPATWMNQGRYDDDDREWTKIWTSGNIDSPAPQDSEGRRNGVGSSPRPHPARPRGEAGKYDGL